MQNSDKILKTISKLIENSVLSSKDIKDQISTDFKFKRVVLSRPPIDPSFLQSVYSCASVN